MAAGDPIAVTNNLISTLGTFQTVTVMAADADTANLAQDFIYTPTGRDNKIAIFLQVANTHGAVATTIAAGVGVFGTAAKTDSVAQNTTEVLQIETGRYMLANGTIKITLTPASGKKLASEHAAKLYIVELQ
jgi:hypothetical protein